MKIHALSLLHMARNSNVSNWGPRVCLLDKRFVGPVLVEVIGHNLLSLSLFVIHILLSLNFLFLDHPIIIVGPEFYTDIRISDSNSSISTNSRELLDLTDVPIRRTRSLSQIKLPIFLDRRIFRSIKSMLITTLINKDNEDETIPDPRITCYTTFFTTIMLTCSQLDDGNFYATV